MDLRAANIELADHGLERQQGVGVSGDDQRVGFFVGLDDRGIADETGAAAARGGCRGGCRRCCSLAFTGNGLGLLVLQAGQDFDHIFGLRIAQVDHVGIAAAVIQRGVQLHDRGADLEPDRAFAAHQDAVGAFVRREVDLVGLVLAGLRVKRIHDAYEFRRRGVFQRYDLEFVAFGLVHASDDVHQALNVARMVGNDQRVGRVVGGQVALLRHQRAQNRYQLCSRHVIQADDLGNQLVAGCSGGRVHR